jgi:hypothetical protein
MRFYFQRKIGTKIAITETSLNIRGFTSIRAPTDGIIYTLTDLADNAYNKPLPTVD